ncbi:MAG: sodium/solute symporter [Planctomycetota bacterium]
MSESINSGFTHRTAILADAGVGLSAIDLIVLLTFVVVTVAFALWKSRKLGDGSDFFLGGRSLTWPVIGLSIVAANISTEQMVGMAGNAAGGTGLAVSLWQLVGSIGIVLIAWTLLPKFLRAGISTIPEFLEYRYDITARSIMALLTVAIYVVVLLTAVLYSGGVVLRTIFGLELWIGALVMGLLAAGYTAIGGLRAVAFADLFLGTALLIGGAIVFFLGINEIGGWASFAEANAEKLHITLPADDQNLPWTGVVGGMWIVILYYCGLNQFIVQRSLAAKTLSEGQLGVIFAGALWLLVPFVIVMPGLMAHQLYADQMATSDEAFPTLIRNLMGPGLRGFMFAAIAGAVISSLASMLNSASTIFTMDVYQRLIARGKASDKMLSFVGRVTIIASVVLSCALAPMLDQPRFGGVFQFIQQFQGYIWPGVVAAFIFGIWVKRTPKMSGSIALVLGPIVYLILQQTQSSGDSIAAGSPDGLHNIHYLLQVLISFAVCSVVLAALTLAIPLSEPVQLPIREEIATRTEKKVYLAGSLVILAVFVFIAVFW